MEMKRGGEKNKRKKEVCAQHFDSGQGALHQHHHRRWWDCGWRDGA